jgi:formyltetrahydrofolate synthetase
MGYGKLPVCIAKTRYSFTTNADAPSDFVIPAALNFHAWELPDQWAG